MEKTLVVIDGNSLINRGYYAIQKPMITKEGIYTQGIYAFLSMLTKIRADYNPTHMLVAFDMKAPTFRHLEYKGYKAGRKGMPIELAMEMPILKDILDAMGIARFEIEGYEADDIIGTATRIAEEDGVKSFIITGDRDALQLATDLTSVIINKRGMTDFKLYDDNAMMEEYGFDHVQFIDYKALRGDASDNIPGIPGVGEKTATALIKQFGSLEALISNVEQVSNAKLRAKIEDGAMSAMMSKRLATIVRNVPMDMGLDDFIIREENTDALINLYTKLEFKKFLSSLVSSPKVSSSSDAAEFDYPESVVITDEDEALKLLSSANELYFDYSGNDDHISKPIISAFSVLLNEKVYSFRFDGLSDALCHAFSGQGFKLFTYKLLPFLFFLDANGADITKLEIGFDCSIALYLLNSTSKERSLNEVILEYFHISLDDGEKQMSLIDTEETEEDDNKRVFLIYQLCAILNKEISNAGLKDVLYDIELPLVRVLASMEAAGISIDPDALKEYGKMLKANISTFEQEIKDLAGEDFNVNSPQQLGHILFERLGLPAGKKTTKGYSTNAEILEKLAPDYPIVAKVLEYRSYAKLNSTYVEGLLPLVADDRKIHAHFQQTVTATGRISCTEPNLQNIPIRSELGRQLRKVFTASGKDRVFVGADYSQIELRVLASMSGDETLIAAFNEGHDIHKETASKVFNVPLEDVTPQLRSNAKAVNFGVVYGMSSFGLSSELTISRKEAEKYISDYFQRFPDVKRYLDSCIKHCRETGEIRTLYGRRRIVPEINAGAYMVRQLGERLAMNTPIQGTAADIIKLAMNRIYEKLNAELPDAKLVLQIHDELIIECNKKDAEKATELLRDCMENVMIMPVRLIAEASTAYNWYDL